MRAAVEEVVYRSCLLLDSMDFDGFLDLCDDAFRYTVHVRSPEIRRDMVWLDHDKPELQALFRNLPRHHSDGAPLTRHATVYTVLFDSERTQALVVSALQVFRTVLDGGETSLFAVGKLRDTVRLKEDGARLLKREVRLDTRQLGIGSHIPF
jgi:methanesulfonate monooxygenase small subunit